MSENSPSFHDTSTVTEVPVGMPYGSALNINNTSLETQAPGNTPFVPPATPTPRHIPAIPTVYPANDQGSLEVVPDKYNEDPPPRQQLAYDDTAMDVSGDQNSAGHYWEPPPDRRGTLNSDPNAVCMYYERHHQNMGPPPFGSGSSATINYNTAGAASGPQSRLIPCGFEQWRSSIGMQVNRYSQGPPGMGGGDGQYEDPRVSYLPNDCGVPTFDATGMDERFAQMMDFNLHQFDIMMQQMHELSHTGRSQARQTLLSEASSPPRTSNMFQAKVEHEEYETEVKLQNDPENQMSFSSLKNRA